MADKKVDDSKVEETKVPDVPVQEPSYKEITSDELTELVKQADEDFAHIGGDSRAWTTQAFLPLLKGKQIFIKE